MNDLEISDELKMRVLQAQIILQIRVIENKEKGVLQTELLHFVNTTSKEESQWIYDEYSIKYGEDGIDQLLFGKLGVH